LLDPRIGITGNEAVNETAKAGLDQTISAVTICAPYLLCNIKQLFAHMGQQL